MSSNLELFLEPHNQDSSPASAPLAERLRPASWKDFENLTGLDAKFKEFLEQGVGQPPSIVLWGPPGCGKTTLARLIGSSFKLRFVPFSAVLGGVKEVREVVEQAKRYKEPTLLFVDEIHRFNKGQQDAFLPHVESGRIILIGATTENPSFALNSALLSRARVLSLGGLQEHAIHNILVRAAEELGLGVESDALVQLARVAEGDARRALNLLESFQRLYPGSSLGVEKLAEFLKNQGHFNYDRDGDHHYNLASAFIKSLRGSDPDAALYWGFRMIESGEPPRFIFRRLIIFSSEDIGNADPRAVQIAISTSDAFERVGLPEGLIPLSQCICYLATAPKSNRSYVALQKVKEAIRNFPNESVPLHLRNAPTDLLKKQGNGKNYQYPHDHPNGFVPGVKYLPDSLQDQKFYEVSEHGYEKSILERMNFWNKLK